MTPFDALVGWLYKEETPAPVPESPAVSVKGEVTLPLAPLLDVVFGAAAEPAPAVTKLSKPSKKTEGLETVVVASAPKHDQPLRQLLALFFGHQSQTSSRIPHRSNGRAEENQTQKSNQDNETPLVIAPVTIPAQEPVKPLAFYLDFENEASEAVGGRSEQPLMAPEKTKPEPKAAIGEMSFSARIEEPAAKATTPAEAPATNTKSLIEEGAVERRPVTESAPAAVKPVLESAAYPAAMNTAKVAEPVAETTASPAEAKPEPQAAHKIAEPIPVEPQTRDVAVKIEGPGQTHTTLRIRELAGEVRVSVHTPDAELSRALRTELDQLSTRMENSGVRATLSHPVTAAAAASQAETNSQSQSQSQQQSTGHRDGHPQEQQQRRGRWNQAMEKYYAD